MRRFIVFSLILSAAACVAALAGAPAHAHDFLWHNPDYPRVAYLHPFHHFGHLPAVYSHSGWAGMGFHDFDSAGSWGSSGSSGSSGSWGSSGSSGSSGSFSSFGHFLASLGSHGSSGSSGSSGSWGSSGSSGSSGSWGSSGSHGWADYGDGYIEGDEAPAAAPQGESVPAETEKAALVVPDDGAGFVLHVPADAKVFVNGKATSSSGPVRTYVARGMKPGSTYTFNVRAEFEHDGKPVSQTKSLKMQAGGKSLVAFRAPATRPTVDRTERVETLLTVHVPADAKVYLAGRPTTSTGEVRRFVTKRLTPGAEHRDFTVRVTLECDGRELVQDRAVTLKAGQTSELEFQFDQQLAEKHPPVQRQSDGQQDTASPQAERVASFAD